ncbi:MAG: DUF4131 domain-containing protein, partial [Candidatus Niyogibacteria bacterium]|nr:DUF4131 domain-containing protein [Candidatus Niyogibacteria bacterium]
MREKALLLTIAGFGAGIAFRSFFDVSSASALFGILVSLFFFLFWRVRQKSFFLTLAIFIFAASAGIFRFDMKDKGGVGEEWQTFIGDRVVVRGIIIDEPDEREHYTRIALSADETFDWEAKEWTAIPREKILLTVNHYPSFSYGDSIEARGELERPENFGDSEFDWKSYLAKDEIYLQMFYPAIKEFNGEQRLTLPIYAKKILFSLKE